MKNDAKAVQADLWDEYCSVIKIHNHAGHSCLDTLNRLLQKQPYWPKDDRPNIRRSELELSVEYWKSDDLWELVHPTKRTEQPPKKLEGSVVLLRWHGDNYLMDGRRRICAWKRQEHRGSHRAVILSGPK